MLISDWKTIGTAGDTIDGREIKEQDLIDAAETYDKNEYTAVINSDHELWWFGNFGHVEKVRLGKDKKGRMILQAKLAPNFRLIEKNRNGQGMFTSMELMPDFAKSGKTYLTGLAVTDMPASVGTTMLNLFSRRQTHGNVDNQNNPKIMKQFIPMNLNEYSDPCEQTEDKKFFSRMAAFFSNFAHEITEDDSMDKQQWEKLTTQNSEIIKTLSAISQALQALAQESETQSENGTKTESTEKHTQPAADLEKLTATVTETNSLVKKLSETFTQLLQERPGSTQQSFNQGHSETEFV